MNMPYSIVSWQPMPLHLLRLALQLFRHAQPYQCMSVRHDVTNHADSRLRRRRSAHTYRQYSGRQWLRYLVSVQLLARSGRITNRGQSPASALHVVAFLLTHQTKTKRNMSDGFASNGIPRRPLVSSLCSKWRSRAPEGHNGPSYPTTPRAKFVPWRRSPG